MQLLTLGLNHQTAPLALRERLAFVPTEVGSTIAQMRSNLSTRDAGRLTEAAIVSTCNRTELYCAVEQPDGLIAARRIGSVYHRAGARGDGGAHWGLQRLASGCTPPEDIARRLSLAAPSPPTRRLLA